MLGTDRARRRLVGQLLRLGGLALVLLATVLAMPRTPAYAQVWAAANPLAAISRIIAQEPPEQTTTVEFSASPSPTPLPAGPPPAPRIHAGGPIRFTITGSLGLGTQLHSQTISQGAFPPIVGTSPTPAPSSSTFPFQNVTTTQNTTQEVASLQAEVTRRTATTFTDLRFPIGWAGGYGGGTVLGGVQALYSTPRYSIGYSSQPLLLFGELPLGSTLRGFTFILPFRNGQTTFYEGPIDGTKGEILRIAGAISQAVFGQYFVEGGLAASNGPYSGNTKTFLFGGATARGDLDVIGEGAWQVRNCAQAVQSAVTGCDGTPNLPAFQMRLDDASQTLGFGVTLREVPDKFIAYGAGEIRGDLYTDANVHYMGTTTSLFADASWEHTGDALFGINTQYLESFGISGATRLGGYSLGLQQQNVTGDYQGTVQKQSTSTVQAQFATNLSATQVALATQLSRSVLVGIPGSTALASLTVAHQFGSYGVQALLQGQRQTLAGAGATASVNEGFSLFKQFGRTTIGFTGTLQHTTSPLSNAIQRLPLLTVARQISPALTVAASAGYQTLTDKLNPSANGHSRIFTIQLTAPFEYGTGLTTGRADPRLPATITGHVIAQYTVGNSPSAAMLASVGSTQGGLGNVEVVLDNKDVQRTDLTGGFQFSFLTAGQHQLRVETSSLPHGVTVATPVATVTLQGGQTATVLFQVGTFGGILGHVTGLDASGAKLPLASVQLRLDGQATSQTDSTGAYGFGGLSAGEHTVEVVESTIPAFASFDPSALKQKVTVSNGAYSHLDFSAQPLGSIAGKIVFSADMASDNLIGGVPNAYVVAEPGEHAAIDDNDGSFIIDNLPPGDYTVSVDTETVPQSLGATPESISVHLGAGEHYEGAAFSVGRFEKKVVFSLLNGSGAAPSAPIVHLGEHRLPPLATTLVSVNAPADAQAVTAIAFSTKVPLKYDKTRNLWLGEIAVPEGTKAGNYSVTAGAAAGTQPAAAGLVVDPKIPLATLTFSPANPSKGQIVKVKARFLVDVQEGDTIEWEDGTRTVLGKPVSGRVFTFDLVVSLRPLHGVLLTKHTRLPIEVL